MEATWLMRRELMSDLAGGLMTGGSMDSYGSTGNPGRRDFDDGQEINYRGVMRATATTGYAGYVGHEFIHKGNPRIAPRFQATRCMIRERLHYANQIICT